MKASRHIISRQISDLEFLVVNTVTGAVDITDLNVYRFLCENEEPQPTMIDASILERLETRGYLVDSYESETASMQKLGAILDNRKKRLSLIICPTYSCNFRCTYCFEGSLPVSSSIRMTGTEVPRILSAIDELCQTYGERQASIELFGGEPLLPSARDFVNSLINGAESRNIPVSIVTNGTYIPLYATDLEQHKSIIRSVQVTLDGPASVHNLRRKLAGGGGTFDIVFKSLRIRAGRSIIILLAVCHRCSTILFQAHMNTWFQKTFLLKRSSI
jgi:uncharacterized protein